MNLLFLYTEVMGYTIATLRELSRRGFRVHVVHWDHKKLTPFKLGEYPNIHWYPRSGFDAQSMMVLVDNLSPGIVYVSGWQDKDYLKVARYVRSLNRPVVTGFDDVWLGTVRQRVASHLCKFGYLKRFFSHAWVSGPWQFEYAQRMGFEKENVIFDLYSADTVNFEPTYERNALIKQVRYPHRFLFVGRFEHRKGLISLVDAWKQIEPYRKDWKLQIIGNGTLELELKNLSEIEVLDFLQPEELQDVIESAGCFVLPSIREPWGVVVHEFATAGLPLILSNTVGAGPCFLIPGYNGFTFEAGNAESLARCMIAVIEKSDADLFIMGQHSNHLSKRISPGSSASNFLSIYHLSR